MDPLSDFFDAHSGMATPLRRRSALALRTLDWLYDRALRHSAGLKRVRASAANRPAERVLIVGIEVPSRPADIHRVVDAIKAGSRHHIVTSITPMGDRGKFANIDVAIHEAPEPLSSFDWLVVTDDDITFAPGFLDDVIALAEHADLAILQPAHAFESHASYAITKRHRKSLVRRTSFVEIGPLTLFRADAFAAYIPFPESRWCYGIDLLWTDLAQKNGLHMGIVDAAPVQHLRPIAGSYSMGKAVDEGRAFLRRFDLRLKRDDLWKINEVVLATD